VKPVHGADIEAVVFDWGGTLSVWADVDAEDMWRLAARRLAPGREHELLRVLVALEKEAWDRVETDRRSTCLAELLATASAAVEVVVADAVLDEAAQCHLDSWAPHIRHREDAGCVLSSLRAAGLRVGLLSNTYWPRLFHERLLERDGLAPHIDAGLYTCEMGRVKPDPSVFRAALDALDVSDPARAVFVGDRLLDDVSGARAAGMRSVWVRNQVTPPYDVVPDAVVEALGELPGVLARWGVGHARV